MGEKRKRQQEEEEEYGTIDSPRKVRSGSLETTESESGSEVGEDIMAWLSIDNETAFDQVLNLLDADSETSVSAAAKVRFIDNPYSRPLIFQSSSSYVTINGNEESCGSSFSDTESSMMASVDARGINIARHILSADERKAVGLGSQVEDSGGAWELNEGEARGWEAVEDWDYEMLARFLGED